MKRIQKIKEVCTISGGYAFKSNDFTRQGIPIIRIGDISGNKVKISSGTVFFEEYNEKLNKFIIEKGDILVALSGATTGKFGIYDEEIQALLNQRVAKISPKENINNKYLYHYMNKLQNIIYNKALGCAQPNISPNEIGEIEIYVPSRLEQDKISDVLDIAKDLIDKRKKQIEELDLLVKSKFIEMFGDPYLNPKRWAKKELKEIMLLANNGLSRRGNDLDGNIVLRLVELQDGYLDYTSVNRIKLTESEEKRYLLKDGDFLFARVNGNPDNVGRCAYYQEIGEKVFHNDHIIRVRFDNTLINNCFVSTMLNSGYGKLQMKDKLKTSAGQYTVNQTGISEIKVVVPPIELQNKFEDFVKQIDKLKFEMEKSLKELEDNFNSLMQKAFKGEILI
ncbi:restriction endonuclease subunit S [Clostridium perfringens]|nr:restriction endonuclease subunit S [Clostridium perfringens]